LLSVHLLLKRFWSRPTTSVPELEPLPPTAPSANVRLAHAKIAVFQVSPDHQVLLETTANLVSPVYLVNLDSLDAQVQFALNPQLHPADPAHLDHPAHPAHRDLLVTPVRTVPLDVPEMTEIPVLPDPVDHKEILDPPVPMDHREILEHQHQAPLPSLATLDPKATLDPTDHLDHPAQMDQTDNPEAPDQRDPPEKVVLLAEMAIRDRMAPLDHRDPTESAVSAPNTAHWMAVSFSKMEPGDKPFDCKFFSIDCFFATDFYFMMTSLKLLIMPMFLTRFYTIKNYRRGKLE